MGGTQATTFRNNFDFLRILFASFVIVSHGYFLLDGKSEDPFSKYLYHTELSTLGVYGFFVLSGYLIFQSLQNTAKLSRFLVKRFKRIMPGLVVAVGLTVFLLGPLMSNLGASAYLGASKVYLYLVKTIFFLPTDNLLPGVFEQNPLPFINGSLWTLRYEVLCYLSLCIFFLFRKQQRLYATLMFALLLLLRLLNMRGLLAVGSGLDAHLGNFFNLFYCFYAGVLLKAWGEQVLKYKRALFLASIVLLLASYLFPAPVGQALFLSVFPFAVLSAGLLYVKCLQIPAKIGDISYGTYIYAFPVQQALISTGMQQVAVLIGLSLILSWTLGFLSFHFVERKFLARYSSGPK